jgi:hypothetical protein
MQYILLAQDGAEYDEQGDRLRKERGKSAQGGQYGKHTKTKKQPRFQIYNHQHQPFQRFPMRNFSNRMVYRNIKRSQYFYRMNNPNLKQHPYRQTIIQ